MSTFYDKTADEALKALTADSVNGLAASEAEKRLAQNGPNKLMSAKQKSIWQMLAEQFKDFLVIILIVAAAVSMVVGIINDEGILDSLVILAIVVINAIIGVSQEAKANNALAALEKMSSPHSKVIRDGVLVRVPSESVVAGDIVELDAGDYVPADLRLIETINLKVEEAALTGESLPVEKNRSAILPEDAPLGDRVNSAYMGTVVTYGRGKGVVTATGMNTQMGSIAAMLNEHTEEATPLQQKLNNLGKALGIVCIAVCALIFVLGLFQGDPLMEIFMVSIALAVAAIPEGLTVVITVLLALGMQKMVKSNVIIKRLSAVETLGSTTTICSDKTGTLTQNKMMAVKVFDYDSTYEVTGNGYDRRGEVIPAGGREISENINTLITCCVLCNDASYDAEKGQIIGDPTEGAMLVLGEKIGLSKAGLNAAFPRRQEIPFDSARKLMSTFHETDGGLRMYTKGAPDEVLKRCTHILKNGAVTPISEADIDAIRAANAEFAGGALRVLGGAFKDVDTLEGFDEQEKELVYVGLVGMIDPPREEVRPSVEKCKHAGISVKMITGDHRITAGAIAKSLGIMQEGEETVEGIEIDAMTDYELQEKAKTVNVFARVSPEHKVRLVNACKENGEIVAMTGDGVNDAPSLKKANIGIAMGITGTDVSKEAADMILTDDNFVSIVSAVEEGRTIYGNIRKVVGYLLSCNIGEILLIFLAMLMGAASPLMPIHLLAVNLITDAFPAFALGMEEKEEGVMDQKPRDPGEPIINNKMMIAVAIQSLCLGGASLAAFLVGNSLYGIEIGRTICFITLVIGESLRAYSNRSENRSVFRMKFLSNSFLNKSVLVSLAFLALSVWLPFLNPIFATVPLTASQFMYCLIFAAIPLVGGEIAKVIAYKPIRENVA